MDSVAHVQHAGSRAESGKNKGFSCTWDSLRNSAGEKILQLRSHPLNMPSDSNFCSLLSDLSLEQRFDISYLDLGEWEQLPPPPPLNRPPSLSSPVRLLLTASSVLTAEERSLSGLCQCLVELSTQPITVCHGFAPSIEAARANAAHNALKYLKIMAGSK